MTPLERWLERVSDPRDWVPMMTVKLETTLASLDERFRAWRADRRRVKQIRAEQINKVKTGMAARVEFLRQLELDDAAHREEMADLINDILVLASACAERLRDDTKKQGRMYFGYVTFYKISGGFINVTVDSEILLDSQPLFLGSLHYRDLQTLNERMEQRMGVTA